MLVSDILPDAAEILGQCDKDKLYARLTDAIDVLANKGDWSPLIGYVDLCTCSDGRTVTLPRDIETPLAVNINGQPAYFRNKWYEFHLNGTGSFSQVKWAWDDVGEVPVFMDIIKPSNLVAIADVKTDKNGKIRIFGWDEFGRWIRTQNPDGTWLDGFELPINIANDFPFGAIQPATQRIIVRNFKTKDITLLVSSTDHQFVTGATVVVSLITPPLPAPLVNGGTYFVRAFDNDEISLHNSVSGALSDIDKVIFTSAGLTSELLVSNKRQVKVLTKFNSVTPHNLQTAQIVQFDAVTFPTPITANTEYFAHPIDANNFTVHATASDADTNTNPIDVSSAGAGIVLQAEQAIAARTKLVFSTNHNFIQGDAVRVVNSSGQLPNPLLEGVDYYARILTPREITLHNSLADATNGVFPIVLTSSGAGLNSVVKTIPCSISVGNANNCTAVNHNLNQAGGDFVQFSTTGILPTPLAQNTAYRAEPPMSNDTFTINTTVPAPVDITALGSGQHFLLISRVFTVGFTSQLETDATNLTTGTGVKVESDGSLPAANPPLNPNTVYFVRKIDDTTIELFEFQAWALDSAVRSTSARSRAANIATLTVTAHGFASGDFVDVSTMGNSTYNAERAQITVIDPDTFTYTNVGANEANTADVSGRIRRSNIKISGVGDGNVNLLIETNVTAVIDLPYLRAELDYLAEDTIVQFETDGTLPSPLVTNTDYTISFVQGLIQVETLGNIPIPITSIGDGNHTMAINRVFGITIPTSVEVLNNIYENGDQVLAQTTGTLPTPLLAQNYFLRRIGDDEVEIYDTAAHAKDLNNTIGRIQPLDTGTGNHTFLQIKDAIKVSKVSRVEKSLTDGFISLYAWDYGRLNYLTLLGYYYPDEVAPTYRRIKIGSCCSWVRMRYRKRLFKIRSDQDFIPMTNKMAILMMLKSLELYRTNFTDEAKRYEQQAVEFLEDEYSATEGPNTVFIQVNSPIFTNPHAQWMM